MRTTARVNGLSSRSGGSADLKEPHLNNPVPRPGVMGASTLEGKPVVNAAGEDLGHVEKVMLDVSRGEIAYAVLSFGSAFGAGHKIAAVPWSALVLDTERKCFILDQSSENGFDKEQCPGPDWHPEAGRYYGA